jgi:hypothetical protein
MIDFMGSPPVRRENNARNAPQFRNRFLAIGSGKRPFRSPGSRRTVLCFHTARWDKATHRNVTNFTQSNEKAALASLRCGA